MKAKRLLAGLLGLFMSISLASCSRSPDMPSSKTPVQWEYCELGLTEAGDGLVAKMEVYYAAGGKRIQEPTWEDLAKTLDFKGDRNEIFDHLGTQGWELCTSFSYPNLRRDGAIFSVEVRWIFKRIRR
jgi:hypothetical protein